MNKPSQSASLLLIALLLCSTPADAKWWDLGRKPKPKFGPVIPGWDHSDAQEAAKESGEITPKPATQALPQVTPADNAKSVSNPGNLPGFDNASSGGKLMPGFDGNTGATRTVHGKKKDKKKYTTTITQPTMLMSSFGTVQEKQKRGLAAMLSPSTVLKKHPRMKLAIARSKQRWARHQAQRQNNRGLSMGMGLPGFSGSK